MNISEEAKRLGISRKTLYKRMKQGAESVTPESVTPPTVTPQVLPPEMSECSRRMLAGFTPNWKRNGYDSAEQARQTAVQMVIDAGIGAQVIYQGEVYE